MGWFSAFKKEYILKSIALSTLLVLGVLFPLRAHAQLFALIGNYLLNLVLWLPVILSNFLVAIASFILDWVLSPDFINWNYTGFGATGTQVENPLVKTGWRLTRDLTNMLFVIYLAFIGLATALRIKEYEAKKLLPKLIMIAILINFTPTICGAIIDASNIITNFFLGTFSFRQVFTSRTQQQFQDLYGDFMSLKSLDPFHAFDRNVRGLILTVFNVVTALMLFLFAFIFAARYLALWILVILSPFAFFSYVVPRFQNFWKQWWNQFFQWCFIGVTGSFFLYLSNLMLNHVGDMTSTPSADTSWYIAPLVGTLQTIIPYAMILGFMMFGFTKSLTSSAMYSDKIINAAKYTGGEIGGLLKEQTWERAKASEQAERTAEGMAETPGLGKLATKQGREQWREAWGEASAWKKAGMAIGSVTPFSGAVARPALRAVDESREDIQKQADQLEKEYKGQTEMLKAHVQSLPARKWKEKMAGTMALAKVGGPQALDDLEKAKPGTIEKTLSMMKSYRMREMMKDFVKYKPDLIMEVDEDEDARQKLEDNFGDLHLGLDLTKEEDQKELMRRVKEKLSEMGNESGAKIVEELIWRGLEDENVTELMEAGYEAGEAVVGAAFKQIVEEIKPSEISDLSDVVLKNPLFQEMAARYQSTNFAREILDQGGGIRDQFINTLNRVGGEELIETNESLVRWILYSWEGQARVGPIEEAETKEEYKLRSRLKNLLESDSLLQERLETEREISLSEQELGKMRSAGLAGTPAYRNLEDYVNNKLKPALGKVEKKISSDDKLRRKWQEIKRTEEELLRSLPIEVEIEKILEDWVKNFRGKKAAELEEKEIARLRSYEKRLQEIASIRKHLTSDQKKALQAALKARRKEGIPQLLKDVGYE